MVVNTQTIILPDWSEAHEPRDFIYAKKRYTLLKEMQLVLDP